MWRLGESFVLSRKLCSDSLAQDKKTTINGMMRLVDGEYPCHEKAIGMAPTGNGTKTL